VTPDLKDMRAKIRAQRGAGAPLQRPANTNPPQQTTTSPTPTSPTPAPPPAPLSFNALVAAWCTSHDEQLTGILFLIGLVLGLINGLLHNQLIPALLIAFFAGSFIARFIVWLLCQYPPAGFLVAGFVLVMAL
jgi:hypothetical protein